MKKSLLALTFLFAMGLAATDSDAARRFGGGGNTGKQRPAPTAREAAPATPAAPANSTQAAPAKTPAAAPAAPAPKPSFMSRWGGLLAGLGIGMLLASMFGPQLGPIVGMLLMALLIGGGAFLLWRLFAARKAPESRPVQFAGIGSAASAPIVTPLASDSAVQPEIEPRVAAPSALSAAEREPFLRVAKTSFIRLQAANDAGDLDDIRDYTTPEMFAELSMQVQERGDAAQKTEVVMVNAQLVEDVVEGDYAIASVRFSGLIRENDAANPAPFDEIWHVRKSLKDRKGSWLISGIQQVEEATG